MGLGLGLFFLVSFKIPNPNPNPNPLHTCSLAGNRSILLTVPDRYRSAASLIVLRAIGGGYQLLLLHKPRKKDSWQLPQGGVEEGETIEQAALRELQEEAGLSDCQVLGHSKKVYQYDFPPSFRRFRPDNVCGQRIEYIFTLAKPNAQVKVDEKEINDYKWIGIEDLTKYVRREEYLTLVRELYEEALGILGK
jgi:putative (di)nucleoside polyphosphate hydrolase